MNAAIIAAGEGSRLQTDGVAVAKPLVPICGVPLIDRLIRMALASHAESLSIIVNEEMTDVRRYCENLSLSIPLNLLVRSTPSSMHSLFALAPYLNHAPFYLTTVDTIFLEVEFKKYLAFAQHQQHTDGVLAVTDFIDDEKPLCAKLDKQQRITTFSDSQEGYRWATGGIYYFSPRIFNLIPDALAANTVRLRNFLRLLLQHHYTLHGYAFSKIIDVDHAKDIAAAEEFLTSHNERS
ncbi:MAG TPA: NTP transferase domain-containing protein [Bacteroidota bacterium]|nr:NTP transferase domain-containing protein [Bacteroidota bacterium]